MLRKDLVAAMASGAVIRNREADAALSSLLLAWREALSRGESVVLSGYLRLSVKEVAGRSARNPKTGAPVPVPARRRVRVKVGRKLSEVVS